MESWSNHANRRSAQRSVPAEHVELALLWGSEIRQGGGRTAYHLGHLEADAARTTGIGVPERAVGVAVVLARDGTIVTVVRSPDRERLRAHGRSPRRRSPGATR
jgi:hypothetical protein